MTRETRSVCAALAASAAILAIGLAAGEAAAQEREFPGWDRIPARDKLLAVRAAEVRGMRDLGRVILALEVGGERLSDSIGPSAADPNVAGLLVHGFDKGEPRYTADGFARVAIRISTASAWDNLMELGLALPPSLAYTAFREAAGGDAIEVEGLGRPPGFPADIKKYEVPPAPRGDGGEKKEKGALPDSGDRRFGAEDDESEDRFAEREGATPEPREKPLEDEDAFDPGERVVEDTGWRTVSEEIVRTWEDDAPSCGESTEDGRWEVTSEVVVSRKVISESVVVK
ncbi:MAG: hypothetical protein HY720_26040 [Planctomycetes bacterium]|nr:hypothetical protein [Planctomycetota bacterium]